MSIHAIAWNKDPRDVIVRPIVSEKSYTLIDQGKYTFEVDPRATKTEIKLAIEKIFKRHPGGTVAVVVPRPLDAIVTWLVSGRSMGDLWRFDAAADLVDVLPVAAQWQPPRPGMAVTPANQLESAPSQPFVSR
jgi:hypothetical protein